MKTQLEGEENSMKDMMKAMQTRALLEKFEAERKANVNGADAETKANVNDADQINQETGPTTKQHAQTFLPISPRNLNDVSSTGSPVWRSIPVRQKAKQSLNEQPKPFAVSRFHFATTDSNRNLSSFSPESNL
ncbi:hypothetical protein OIU77_000861 [Salix suchowensis]|nr:hypothetical protein OIU77_000861 [Salix suchowensis]